MTDPAEAIEFKTEVENLNRTARRKEAVVEQKKLELKYAKEELDSAIYDLR